MRSKTSLLAFFLLGVLNGISSSGILEKSYGTIMYYNIYSTTTFVIADLLNFSLDLLPLMIIIFLYGFSTQKKFVYCAPYFLSRVNNRGKWIGKEITILLLSVTKLWLVYTFSFYLPILLNTNFYRVDNLWLIIIQVLLNILLTSFFVLLANSISMKTGTYYAYIVVIVLIFTSVFILNIQSLSTTSKVLGYILLILNPLANVNIYWHLSSTGLNLWTFSHTIPVVFSIVYLVFLVIMSRMLLKHFTIAHNMLDRIEQE